MHILGGKCVYCGTVEALTFDCIKPMGREHHGMSSAQRMGFYRRQWRNGNLQILCNLCNIKKSNKPAPKYIICAAPTAEPRA